MSSNIDIMNLLMATNESYLIATRTLLASIKKAHERTKDLLHVFVMYSNLSDASIEKIMGDSDEKCRIELVFVDDGIFEGFPLFHFWTKETYFRLLASDYLPNELDRILWLDSDMIVVNSLAEFYYQNIDTFYYAAYEDEYINANEEYSLRLGIGAGIPYVQAGTLLINLDEIRKERSWKELIAQYVKTNSSRLLYEDQDIINALFNAKGRVKRIAPPCRYNQYANMVSDGEWVVLHYAGREKPWNGNTRKQSFVWWKYACMIPEYRVFYLAFLLKCLRECVINEMKKVYAFLIKRKYGKWIQKMVVFLKKRCRRSR